MKHSVTKLLVIFCLVIFVPGCADRMMDSDGVPIVDVHGTIRPPSAEETAFYQKLGVPSRGTRLLSVQGKQMPLSEFSLTYCQAKFQNETCERVSKIRMIDASGGPKVNLPKGL